LSSTLSRIITEKSVKDIYRGYSSGSRGAIPMPGGERDKVPTLVQAATETVLLLHVSRGDNISVVSMYSAD
jgi:hypothetical protein